MTEPARRRATYDDLVAAPEHLVAELVAGVLYTSPRPAGAHARAATVLTVNVGGPFDQGTGGPGGWVILFEPELHLHGDVLVPDLAGWRRERGLRFNPDSPAVEAAPDWVCEVLSPSTAGLDRMRKLPVYVREGVRYVWLADPGLRTLEAFRRDGEGWVLVDSPVGDERVRLEPFASVELDLAALWSW